MKKKQIIGFLKAPFSGSFIISYLFSLFLLLSVPLLSNLIHLLFKNLDTINNLPEDKIAEFVIPLLKRGIYFPDILFAIFGICIAFTLLSSYSLLLTHKTAVSKKGIFDAEKISLSIFEILSSIPKFLGFVILSVVSISLFMAILIAANFLIVFCGTAISKILGSLLFIISIIASIYVTYRFICYFVAFCFLFYKEFRLTSFFKYQEVNSFFLKKKKNILIAWLLLFVAGQITYTLYTSISINILEKILIAGSFLEALHLSNSLPVAFGILIWSFFVTYFTLLQAIVLGKIVVWLGKAKK